MARYNETNIGQMSFETSYGDARKLRKTFLFFLLNYECSKIPSFIYMMHSSSR